MLRQLNLKGEVDKPFKDVCCEACYNATQDECECRCGGRFHGLGNPNNHRKKRALEDQQHYEQSLAAQHFWQLIPKPCRCRYCNADLENKPILHYPHEAGWKIEGHTKLQWLFITCPNCAYQWALWKLGVKRDAEIILEA